jgi:ribokinase
MKAIGIGEIVLDKTILLDGFVTEGSKVVPQKSENSIGGPVASALILLAKLGVDVSLVASVGNDEAGDVLKKRLASEGVKLIPIMQKRTKVHTVIVNGKNGSRTIIKDNVQQEPITKVSQELINSADIILFDRHEIQAFDFVMQNKKPETKVVVDPSDEVSAKTIKMIQNIDYPILPIEALQKLRRHEGIESNIKAMREIVGKPFIITAGSYGSILCDGEDMQFFPAYDLSVVDTLGAGDIFRGAFAFGLLNNWGIEQTIDYANLVAGLQCTKLGNSTAIPSRSEIQKSQSQLQRKSINLNQLLHSYII